MNFYNGQGRCISRKWIDGGGDSDEEEEEEEEEQQRTTFGDEVTPDVQGSANVRSAAQPQCHDDAVEGSQSPNTGDTSSLSSNDLIEELLKSSIVVKQRPLPDFPDAEHSLQARDFLYFTSQEREQTETLVRAESRHCVSHPDCTDCTNTEYAYYENQAMPTHMPPEDRQRIINNNRSLRNIKNELENLAAEGVISDDTYDVIMRSLPSESTLSSASRSTSAVSPSPAPVNSVSNSIVPEAPPSYNNIPAPIVPSRSQPPSKPEIARAIALYRYADAGDCNFEVGDHISIYQYTNADWWTGKNMRTGVEGVFPANYVQIQTNYSTPTIEAKAQFPGSLPLFQQHQQQSAIMPGPSNPYNASAPPMAIANEHVDGRQPGKGSEMGKKFGKKLGNAAIFGAGATIGADIVNSIF